MHSAGMKLSANFELEEFLRSQTAARQNIDMMPSKEVIWNLTDLCESILQPLRDSLGPIVISSGYRPIQLNKAIGGSKTSVHIDGRAADFRVLGMSPYDVCVYIRDEKLSYDQNIHEFGQWTHVGIAQDLRGEDLTAYKSGGRTRYIHGISKIEDLP